MARRCNLCGNAIKLKVWLDGKMRNLQRRKYCLTCSPFGSGNRSKLGLAPKRSRKESEKLKYKKWQTRVRRERKLKLVEMLGGKCQRCNYSRCLRALDFHHTDPKTKKFTISSMGLIKRWDSLVEEVKKCILLCKNCHAEEEEKIKGLIV